MVDTKLIRLLRSYEIMTNGFKKEMRKMELAENNALEYLKEDDEE